MYAGLRCSSELLAVMKSADRLPHHGLADDFPRLQTARPEKKVRPTSSENRRTTTRRADQRPERRMRNPDRRGWRPGVGPEAISVWWHAKVANAYPPHGRVDRAAVAVEAARRDIASLTGVVSNEMISNSGITEADASAPLGTARAARQLNALRRRIVGSALAHPNVLGRSGSACP